MSNSLYVPYKHTVASIFYKLLIMTSYNFHVVKITGGIDCCQLVILSSQLFTELLEAKHVQLRSSKETRKLLWQVRRARTVIKTLNHHSDPKHNNASQTSLLLHILRVIQGFSLQTVIFVASFHNRMARPSSVLFTEALVFIDQIKEILILTFWPLDSISCECMYVCLLVEGSVPCVSLVLTFHKCL